MSRVDALIVCGGLRHHCLRNDHHGFSHRQATTRPLIHGCDPVVPVPACLCNPPRFSARLWQFNPAAVVCIEYSRNRRAPIESRSQGTTGISNPTVHCLARQATSKLNGQRKICKNRCHGELSANVTEAAVDKGPESKTPGRPTCIRKKSLVKSTDE